MTPVPLDVLCRRILDATMSAKNELVREEDLMRKAFSIGIVALGLFGHCIVRADTAPVDPEVARLDRETARLEAETRMLNAKAANMTARFGAAATAKEGSIGSPEKLSAMGHWTLTEATSAVTREITGKVTDSLKLHCSGADILVTSVEDRRSGAANATIVKDRLAAFIRSLNAALDKDDQRAMMGQLTSVNAIAGLVGTMDSLVGLLRADYAIADLDAAPNNMSLQIKVAGALAEKLQSPVWIDGLAGPGRANALIDLYTEFSTARRGAQARYADAFAKAKSDAEKAALAGVNTLLAAAAELDTALTQPVAGQVPLVQLALADESSGGGSCVVFVKFAAYSASIVTRKRLLSRNDGVAAIAGGSVQMAAFDRTGKLLMVDVIPIDERIGGKLSEIVDSAVPLGGGTGVEDATD